MEIPEIYAQAHYCLPNDTSPHFMPCTGDDCNAIRVMEKQQEFLRFLGHVWQLFAAQSNRLHYAGYHTWEIIA